MNKELEALLNDVDTLQGMYMETRASKENKAWFHSFADDLRNDIKQALQVPTSEDVCKALSEYFKEEVVYENNLFNVYDCKNQKSWGRQSREISLDELYYVPHLITMIGKFYESESESNE